MKKIVIPIVITLAIVAGVVAFFIDKNGGIEIARSRVTYGEAAQEHQSDSYSNDEIAELVAEGTDITCPESLVNFERNYADFIGFLTVDGTQVDYPVMRDRPTSEGEYFYLHHNYKGEEDSAGCTFVLRRQSLENDIISVYGHNMRNGYMFGEIDNFEQEEFFDEHKNGILFDTLVGRREYEAIAVINVSATSTDFSFFGVYDFDDLCTRELLEEQIRELSKFDFNYEFTGDEEYLFLITCEYTHNNGREILVCVKTNEVEYEPIDYGVDYHFVELNEDGFEMPVNGSTGYSYCSQNGMEAGEAFLILSANQSDRTLTIHKQDGEIIDIPMTSCFINLPDVIPSIVYNDTNSYHSIFRTSGNDIEGVTGEAMYDSLRFNERLNYNEYTMPILYEAAESLARIQHRALSRGDTLILYQAFRPYSCQVQVRNGFSSALNNNSSLRTGLGNWSESWFIAQGISNHQVGGAVDITLGRVVDTQCYYQQENYCHYCQVTEYEMYEMQSQMHELSALSVDTVTDVPEEQRRLQNMFLCEGWDTIRSEWWHFDCVHAMNNMTGYSDGNFSIEEIVSIRPVRN